MNRRYNWRLKGFCLSLMGSLKILCKTECFPITINPLTIQQTFTEPLKNRVLRIFLHWFSSNMAVKLQGNCAAVIGSGKEFQRDLIPSKVIRYIRIWFKPFGRELWVQTQLHHNTHISSFPETSSLGGLFLSASLMGRYTTREALLAVDSLRIEMEQAADSNAWPCDRKTMCVELLSVKLEE